MSVQIPIIGSMGDGGKIAFRKALPKKSKKIMRFKIASVGSPPPPPPQLRATIPQIPTGERPQICTSYATGDCMEPLIHDGDLLLVDLFESEISIKRGSDVEAALKVCNQFDDKICALTLNGKRMVKRIQVNDFGQCFLASDNRWKHPARCFATRRGVEDTVNIFGIVRAVFVKGGAR